MKSTTTTDRDVGSSDSSAYRTPDGMLICCLCQCEMEWEDCSACGGDGFFDGYEEDPNWYQPGELADCSQCGGNGGDHICRTTGCKTVTCQRVLPSPNAQAEPRR